MTTSTLDRFRADIESFLARTGMPPTTLGAAALNDRSFVFNLRCGKTKTVTLRTMDRVQSFIANHEKPVAPRQRRGSAVA